MAQLPKQYRFFFLTILLSIASCLKPTGNQLNGQVPEHIQIKAATEFKSAEALFQQGKMTAALAQFQNIEKKYSETTSADNALLRIAQIHKREKNISLAEGTLKKILLKYPNSDIKPQALREIVAIDFQLKKYDETLDYLSQIELKKLSSKDQASLSTIADTCIQKTEREDLVLLWQINKSDISSTPASLDKIKTTVSSLNDPKLLEKIIDRRKTSFPAFEATLQRYKLSKDQKNSDAKKWANYIVEYFPTSPEAREIRSEISEPIPFSGGGTYKIGVLLPLTGEQESYGTQVLNGIKTAIEVVKQDNPNLNLQLIIEDTGLGGDSARKSLQKLLLENQIIACIGPMNSKDTESIAELAQNNHLPVISLSPAENVTNFGTTIFRNSLTKKEQAIGLASLLTDVLHIRRSAILYPNNSYGTEFMELFWKEFEKKGGEIRGAEEYDRNSSDYEIPIKKLTGMWRKDTRKNEICSKMQADLWREMKSKGESLPNCFPIEELPPIVDFEAIFIPDSFDKARQILPTLLYHDVKGAQVVGTNLWNTDELLSGSIGGEIEGSIFLDGFYKSKITSENTNFMQKFYALYNAEPGILEAQGYDSAMILIQILQKRSPSSAEALTNFLFKTNYKGVTGLTGFSANREATREMLTLIVDQNKIVELK